MTYFQSLSAAGFAATAISYGPARMGFGLFVPEFRAAFDLSTSMVGFISAAGFGGFFVGLLIAQLLLNRQGPGVPVLSGLTTATMGILLVATAQGVTQLAIGVTLAASSAGFAWTPFNDAVHRKVREVDRPTALSEISTGTSVGIALAGATALAMVFAGLDWRICWAAFAGASILALIGNWAALRQVEKSPDDGPEKGWRDLLHRSAMPLYWVAFVFGVSSAVFISFAAERFAAAGGVPGMPSGSAPALVFVVFGLFGLVGLATDRVRDRIGLTNLLRVLMVSAAASLAAVALFTGSWFGLIVAAGLQGINVMMTSAVIAFWSERLFPSFPSLGFTSTLMAMATGSVVGPALAGVFSDAQGPGMMFLLFAVLPLTTALALVDWAIVERPAGLGMPPADPA